MIIIKYLKLIYKKIKSMGKTLIILYMFLCLSFGLFKSDQTLASVSVQELASSAAPLSLYLIGMGGTYVVEWLMDSVGAKGFTPEINRPLSKTEQQQESLELEAQSTTIKALKQGIYTGLRIYLEKLLSALKDIPPEIIPLLMRSYDAGSMIDYLRYVRFKASEVLKDIAKTSLESSKQLGELTLSGLKFQINQILNKLISVTKTPSAYRYTLDYPLKTTTTTITCGPKDKYCTQTLSPTEQKLMTQEIQELTDTAEKFVLNNTRLMLQAGTLTVGILFAYLSFHAGLAVSQFLVSTTLPESAVAPAIKTLVQKTIARAIEVTTAERLKNWFIEIINKTGLLEQQGGIQTDTIIVPELENILKTAGFGVVAKEAAIPAQLDHLQALLNLKIS